LLDSKQRKEKKLIRFIDNTAFYNNNEERISNKNKERKKLVPLPYGRLCCS
jgi:hypothetical protein